MAVDVHRDGADGAIFDLVVEPAFAEQLLELAAALGNLEPAVVDLLEAVASREIVSALAAEKNVRPFVEQPPREADRRPRGPESGDRPGAAVAPVHDRRVELDAAGGGENAAAAGIEAGILFEHAHGRFDGFKRRLAFLENRRPGSERCFEAGSSALLLLGIEPSRPHRPRASMHHQPPACHCHDRPLASALPARQLTAMLVHIIMISYFS